jgi:hypothetical protein
MQAVYFLWTRASDIVVVQHSMLGNSTQRFKPDEGGRHIVGRAKYDALQDSASVAFE